jgi:ribosomal protein S18 acetylase RimI-like enzyme
MIRKANEGDLMPLIKVYKEVFKVHNVFDKSEDEILEYLKQFLGDILVAEEDGKVVAGLVIVKKKYAKWSLFGFKHVAVAKAYQRKGVGSELLNEAEKIAGKGKIEIRVAKDAEAEWAVPFYEKNGYRKEGELKSHYRKGEICFVMGKVLE